MDFGLLWYDDTATRTFADKVLRAAARYAEKFGQPPTVCFVNPATLNGNAVEVGAVRIETARTVLPHHFLVGVEEKRNGRKRRNAAE
jgi:hypothetical protein